ncbi:MAG: HEAT repeat domain-containing protein [Fidelibacterota bacterium]
MSDRLKRLAYLYALGELPAKKARRFEKRKESSPELKKLVEELEGTLNLTRMVETREPPEAYLIRQRNLLRGKIEALDTTSIFQSLVEILTDVADRLFQVVTLQRQPAVAAATYLVLGLIIGRFLLSPGIPALRPDMATASVEDRVQAILAQGNLAATRIEPVSNGSDRITFRLRAKDDLTYTGGPEERLVRELLYYLLLNESNPGRRLQSIKLISHFDEDDEMKMVLVAAVLSDENPGVRLKAIKNLASYPPDKTIRDACVKLLLEEDNTAIRMEALNILTHNPDQGLIPILQAVTRLEENPYIRSQAEALLETLVASADDLSGNGEK